jgi:hypothetical protein
MKGAEMPKRSTPRWEPEQLRFLAERVDQRPRDVLAKFVKKFGDRPGVAQKLSHLKRGHTSDPKLRQTIERRLSTVEQKAADEQPPKATAKRQRKAGSKSKS